MASYNHEAYVADALRSVEAQTFQDFEIIVIDDGSRDRTVEAAQSAGTRAKIYTQDNQGVVAARNRGVSLAQGEFICFVDSDDLILPERFEKQVRLLDGDPELGMVFADAYVIDAEGNRVGLVSDVYPVVPGDVAEMLVLHYCFTPLITTTVRTDVLRRTGPFRTPGPICDYMKWIEVAHATGTCYDPTPLGCWRRHESNTSKKANRERSYALTRIALRRVLRKYPALKERIGSRIRKRFARSYFLTGFWFAAEGNVKRARAYYWKAAKTYPWALENWGGVVLTTLPAKGPVSRLHQYVRTKKLPW